MRAVPARTKGEHTVKDEDDVDYLGASGGFHSMCRQLDEQPEWYPTFDEGLAGLRHDHPEWEDHELTPLRVVTWRSEHTFPVPRPPLGGVDEHGKNHLYY